MKKITKTVWRTHDGEEFELESEARKHEFELELTDMLDKSDLYLSRDCSSSTEIAAWIIENLTAINKANSV